MAPLLRAAALAPLPIALLVSACQRPAPRAASPAAGCIDPAKVNPNGMCTMEYNPVCGCNGQTYANPCTARNAGVRTFTTGSCPTRP
ncbi:MAG: kazal domain protein [Hymenobacter sp.]|nr:MAG: kazal domain protein [Hymenobacter sp.]